MATQATVLSESQTADAMLRARARRVVPGGMWGHLNAARLPEGYPQFFASAEGCRVRDVDGREYIDFMCSWGPVLLGHRHPDVEAAARACRDPRHRVPPRIADNDLFAFVDLDVVARKPKASRNPLGQIFV